jgi:hypothetical protein
MSETVGIKETKELLTALGGLGVVAFKAVRAGGSATDISGRIAAAIMGDPGLLVEIKAAVDGSAQIPTELRDLSLGEILELCETSLVTTRKALDAMKEAA